MTQDFLLPVQGKNGHGRRKWNEEEDQSSHICYDIVKEARVKKGREGSEKFCK